ncbi:hypothetical protein GR160_07420 [Flavobacterium sp. Sd200]|uniref:retropepsin-like aspartic protease n=1 Tax=Flavobacterium sp. Sd200 TaxID=2692211 RepID=UPI001367A681|nr:retropepsin-like aspartic protease [Flavobacterium sp. Sd200]MXN91056.1 hypothetical protein [Flavobacterium sp. Sd200]
MKHVLPKICLIVFLLGSFAINAQNIFSANLGGAVQQKYFTTIPYKEVKSKVIVECFINNKPYKFIVDTGAATTITPALYKELNPEIINRVPVSDQSGKIDSLQIVSLQNFKLGDVTFNGIPAMVIKGEQMVFDCFKVDGLIGSNMLRNSAVQFNSQTHMLTITDLPKQLDLKNKFSQKMVTDPVQSNPFITIKIINGKTTGTDQLLFDSGMDSFYDLSYKGFKEVFATISLLKFEAQAIGSYSLGMHGLSEEEESYRLLAPQIEINDYAFNNVTTVTTHGNSSRIGANLFKYGIVTVDYINKKFYFEPFKKEATDLAEKSWPFIPTAKDGKVVVGLVWDKAWAGKINQDDIIVSFDGKTYENTDVCEVMTSNHKSQNNKATLVLKDAKTGSVKQYEIAR